MTGKGEGGLLMEYKHGTYAELTNSKVKYGGSSGTGQNNNSGADHPPDAPDTRAKLGTAKLGTMKLG